MYTKGKLSSDRGLMEEFDGQGSEECKKKKQTVSWEGLSQMP